MYCKHCGKELADEAIMCPDCGMPTGIKPAHKPAPPADGHTAPLGTIALFLALFSFVTGIVYGAFFYTYVASAILLYIIGTASILPGLVSICLGIAVLHRCETERDRSFAIASIVLAGVALLFLFIAGCVLSSTAI